MLRGSIAAPPDITLTSIGPTTVETRERHVASVGIPNVCDRTGNGHISLSWRQ
jgi:hypothetical protein